MIAISHPFTLDTRTGTIAVTSTTKKLYLDRINSLLSTPAYKRPMRPNYGTDMFLALYEAGDDYILAVTEAITEALSIHLPDIKLISLKIIKPNSIGESSVELLVGFPDDTVGVTSVKTAYLLTNGTNVGDIY